MAFFNRGHDIVVGCSVGESVGILVGCTVGPIVGGEVGDTLGDMVGSAVGFVGDLVGPPVGSDVEHAQLSPNDAHWAFDLPFRMHISQPPAHVGLEVGTEVGCAVSSQKLAVTLGGEPLVTSVFPLPHSQQAMLAGDTSSATAIANVPGFPSATIAAV